MSDRKVRIRSCDACGEERVYELGSCDQYRNSYGGMCFSAPKDDMIILSIPKICGTRDFLNFCTLACLRDYIEKQDENTDI